MRGTILNTMLGFGMILIVFAPTALNVSQSWAMPQPRSFDGHRYLLGSEGVPRQVRDNSCGAAVLAILLQWRGEQVHEQDILSKAPLNPAGLSLYEFANLARQVGFNGQWVEAHMENWDALGKPFVAHIDEPFGHYVIVQRRFKDLILVTDPSVGRVAYTTEQFNRVWSKRAFSFL
jgi:ABC-type bacteriocin/lantibiotic exporter with double-glycine peptidase domain